MYVCVNVIPCDWLRPVVQKQLNGTRFNPPPSPLWQCLILLPAALCIPSLPAANRGQYRCGLFLVPLLPRPPHGAVKLALSLKVNLIWTTPALALSSCLSVLRFCLYWLLWNEIMLHCKEGLLDTVNDPLIAVHVPRPSCSLPCYTFYPLPWANVVLKTESYLQTLFHLYRRA